MEPDVATLRTRFDRAQDALRDEPVSSPNGQHPPPVPLGVCLADVEAERVQFLSRGRLALGKVTILDGDPGLGKSTLSVRWAAEITTGKAVLDGHADEPHGVVIMSAEDGVADTIRPRAEAAGADLARIVVLSEHADGTVFSISRDLPQIEAEIQRVGAVLLIIDPLVAFVDASVNINRDQDVRRALAPVRAMAERTGCAVLVLRHFTKMLSNNAVYRGGGSIGIIGAARFGLVVAPDPDEEGVLILASSKCNLGPKPPSFRYRLVGVAGTDVAVIEWAGISERTANELLLVVTESAEDRSALEDATAWLAAEVAEQARPALDLYWDATQHGHSKATLRRAKTALRLQAHKLGMKGGWVWGTVEQIHCLKTEPDPDPDPDQEPDVEPGEDTQRPLPLDLEHLRELEHVRENSGAKPA